MMGLVQSGIILFPVLVLQVVTLPVEFARECALKSWNKTNFLAPEEMPAARKVLMQQLLTYVAAAATALHRSFDYSI